MSQDIREYKLDYCTICGQPHIIEYDFNELSLGQREGREPFIEFICPDVTYMHNINNFTFDTRVNIIMMEPSSAQSKVLAEFKSQWGELNFDDKIQRYKSLDLKFIGVNEEYSNLIQPIISAYCCGYYYPAMTSAGALGERILNRLFYRTKSYFGRNKNNKKIYTKESSDNWDLLIQILEDSKIISGTVAKLFIDLKKYRNDSVHYNESYDFEKNAHKAVKLLSDIICAQFDYVQRTDLCWVFDVPGEILIRSEVVNDPFVKEFILPGSVKITPYCVLTPKSVVQGSNVPIGKLTDEEFIELRIKNKDEN